MSKDRVVVSLGNVVGVKRSRLEETADSQSPPNITHQESPNGDCPLVEKESAEWGYRTGPWRCREDDLLTEAATVYEKSDGSVDWSLVASYVSSRSQKQCYARWNALLKYRGMGDRRGDCDWSAIDDARLDMAVRKHSRKGGGVYWSRVSVELDGERTYQECLKRWTHIMRNKHSNERTGPWSDEEDRKLVDAMKLGVGKGKRGGVNWSKVSEALGETRSSSQCYKRWHNALKQRRRGVAGEVWTGDEDAKVAAGVAMYAGVGLGGSVNWNKVGSYVATEKTATQCQKRWYKVLKSQVERTGQIRTDPWDCGEDKVLYDAVQQCKLPAAQPVALGSQDVTVAPTQPQLVESRQWLTDLQLTISGTDWKRLSSEYMMGKRSPRQCEKRYECLETYRYRIEDDAQTNNDKSGRPCHYPVSTADGEPLMLPSVDPSVDVADSEFHVRTVESTFSNFSPVHVAQVAARTGMWLPEEDNRLIEAVALYNGQGRGGAVDWGRVCEYMGGGRTYDQCRARWNGVLKVRKSRGDSPRSGPWDQNEDDELVKAVERFDGQGKGGGVDWGQVSSHLHAARTPNQCHSRWISVLQHRGRTKMTSSWTDIEDIRLAEAVTKFDGMGRGGSVDWRKMGPDRLSHQLRMRWHTVLKSRLHPSGSFNDCDHSWERWSERQVQLLLAAVESWGYIPRSAGHPGLAVCDAAEQGEMVAHHVDWISVAMEIAETNSDSTQKKINMCSPTSCALAAAPSPLKCLQIWRQLINAKCKGAITAVSSESNSSSLLMQWNDLDDNKLVEAVSLFDVSGRGGGVDWGKVAQCGETSYDDAKLYSSIFRLLCECKWKCYL